MPFLTLPDGLVLGVMTEAEYRDETVCLEPGAMIVTYTDGVTEAMNPEHALIRMLACGDACDAGGSRGRRRG